MCLRLLLYHRNGYRTLWIDLLLKDFIGIPISLRATFFSWTHCEPICTISLRRSYFVSGLLCDLLWSDPDKDVQGWGENDRGVSFTFGADVVSKFLNRHDLDLICRAHQVLGAIFTYGTRYYAPRH